MAGRIIRMTPPTSFGASSTSMKARSAPRYCEEQGLTTDRLRERMAGRSVEWGRLVADWDSLVALLKDEVENSTDGMARRTYKEMKRLIANGDPCGACNSTGGGVECLKCKGTGRRSGGRCRADRCYGGAEFCPACHGRGYIGGDR